MLNKKGKKLDSASLCKECMLAYNCLIPCRAKKKEGNESEKKKKVDEETKVLNGIQANGKPKEKKKSRPKLDAKAQAKNELFKIFSEN